MRPARQFRLALCALAVTGFCAAGARAASTVATYHFNNTFNAAEGGVTAITKVDPLFSGGFQTANVFGVNRTVYRFSGATSPTPALEGGFTLNTTGLVANNDYSVEMIFCFDVATGWHRLVDPYNRTSDNGLYIDPSSNLGVFPVLNGGTIITAGAFHFVTMTNSADTVKLYLDGVFQFSAPTNVMNISNAGNLLNFFLDNTSGPHTDEWSPGKVAMIRLDAGALTDAEVAERYADAAGIGTVVPLPAAATMGLALIAGLAGHRRRRNTL